MMATGVRAGVCDACSSPLDCDTDALTAARLGHKECLIAICTTRPLAVHDISKGERRAGVLHVAAEQGHTETVRWLCDETAAVLDAFDANDATPTYVAAANGHLSCVRYLVGVTGADVNARARDQTTPLMVACQNGRDKTVEWLIGPGRANFHAENSNQVSAVHLAAAKGHLECLKLLTCCRQYKPNELTKDKATPAYFAAQEGHLSCLKWLVDNGKADLSIRNDDGRLPIHATAAGGHLACLQYLATRKGKLQARSGDGGTVLHFAAAAGQLECVQWLVEQQGKTKKLERDSNGGSAIHDAAEHNQVAVVRFFIEDGFDIDVRDDDGRTPLDLAQENENDDITELILKSSLPSLTYTSVNLYRPQSAIYKAEGRPKRLMNKTAVDRLGLSGLGEQKMEESIQQLEEAMPPPALVEGQDEAERLASLDETDGKPGEVQESQLPRQNSAAVLVVNAEEADGGKKRRKARGLSQVQAGDEVFDLSPTSPAVMDDKENKQKKRKVFAFFSNLKQRSKSSQSLSSRGVSSSSLTSPPSDVIEGKTKKKKGRFGFGKMIRRKKSRSSSAATSETEFDMLEDVEGTDTPTQSPSRYSDRQMRRVDSDITSNGTDQVGALADLLEMEDAEDAMQEGRDLDLRRERTVTETEEERADRKRREFESMLFGGNTTAGSGLPCPVVSPLVAGGGIDEGQVSSPPVMSDVFAEAVDPEHVNSLAETTKPKRASTIEEVPPSDVAADADIDGGPELLPIDLAGDTPGDVSIAECRLAENPALSSDAVIDELDVQGKPAVNDSEVHFPETVANKATSDGHSGQSDRADGGSIALDGEEEEVNVVLSNEAEESGMKTGDISLSVNSELPSRVPSGVLDATTCVAASEEDREAHILSADGPTSSNTVDCAECSSEPTTEVCDDADGSSLVVGDRAEEKEVPSVETCPPVEQTAPVVSDQQRSAEENTTTPQAASMADDAHNSIKTLLLPTTEEAADVDIACLSRPVAMTQVSLGDPVEKLSGGPSTEVVKDESPTEHTEIVPESTGHAPKSPDASPDVTPPLSDGVPISATDKPPESSVGKNAIDTSMDDCSSPDATHDTNSPETPADMQAVQNEEPTPEGSQIANQMEQDIVQVSGDDKPVSRYTEFKGDRRPSTAPLQSLDDPNTSPEKPSVAPAMSKEEEAAFVLRAFKAKKEAERKAKLEEEAASKTAGVDETDGRMREQEKTEDGSRKRTSLMSQRLSSYIKRRKSGGRAEELQGSTRESEDVSETRNRTGTVVVRGASESGGATSPELDDVGESDDEDDANAQEVPQPPTPQSPMDSATLAFMALSKEHMEVLEEGERERAALTRQAATALTAIPAVSGDSVPVVFQGCGLLPGLQLWKLTTTKDLEPVPVEDNVALLMEEVYLCLWTKAAVAVKHVIHMWIGKDTPQDKYQALLGHAYSLEQCLGGVVVLQRETQGHESALFLSYFKHGLLCLKASGEGKTHQLLHVQGQRHLSVTEVDVTSKSLNKGDGFILDTDGKLLVWLGASCSENQRRRVLQVAGWLAEKRGGLPVRKVDDSVENSAKTAFWKKLGSRGTIKHAMLGRGVHGIDRKKQRLRLFNVLGSGEKGKLKIMENKSRPLNWSMLPVDGTVVVETDSCMYVWNGEKVMPRDIRNSFQRCDIVTRSRSLSVWMPVVRIRQHGEPPYFKQFFINCPNVDTASLAQLCGTASLLAAPQTIVDKGTGLAMVYNTHRAQPTVIARRRHNMFTSTESYVIKYPYGKGDLKRFLLYTWHGANCSATRCSQTMAAAATIAKGLDCPSIETKITQGHETEHFLSIFKGQLVIFKGAQRSEVSTESRLFCVRGKSAMKASTTQVACKSSSLQSRHAFCLIAQRGSFIWAGKGSTQVERRAAIASLRLLDAGLKTPVRCLEGDEPEAFWQSLGGRASYDSSLLSLEPPRQLARLFHCTMFGGRLVTEEIFNVTQAALARDDILLLDVGNEVFIWIGEAVPAEGRKAISKMTMDYLASDQSGRKPEAVAVTIIPQRFEPLTFTSHFLHWEEHLWDLEPESLEAVEKEVTSKRASVRRHSVVSQTSSSSLHSQSSSSENPSRRSSHPAHPAASDLPEIPSGVELLAEPRKQATEGDNDHKLEDEKKPPETETKALALSVTTLTEQSAGETTTAETAKATTERDSLSSPTALADEVKDPSFSNLAMNAAPVAEVVTIDEGKIDGPSGAAPAVSLVSKAAGEASQSSDDHKSSGPVTPDSAALEPTKKQVEQTGGFSETAVQQPLASNDKAGPTAHECAVGTESVVHQEVKISGGVDGDSKMPNECAASQEASAGKAEPDVPCVLVVDSAKDAAQTVAADGAIEKQGTDTSADKEFVVESDVKVTTPDIPSSIAVSPGEPDHVASPAVGVTVDGPVIEPTATAQPPAVVGVESVDSTSRNGEAEESGGKRNQDRSTTNVEGKASAAAASVDAVGPSTTGTNELPWEKMVPQAAPSIVVSTSSAPTSLAVPGTGKSDPVNSSSLSAATSSLTLSATNLLTSTSGLLLDSNFDLDNLDTIPEALNSLPRQQKQESGGGKESASPASPSHKPAPTTSDDHVITILSIDKTPHKVDVTPKTNAQHLVYKLVNQAGIRLSITLSVVESLGGSQLERRLEDHEKVLDVVSRWPEKNSNTLQLRDAPSKYALFEKPQLPRPVLLSACDRGTVPDISGYLWMKSATQPVWEQHVFVLRSSGIAFSNAEHDIEEDGDPRLAVPFEGTNVYVPTGGQRASGAPSKFSFVIKGTQPDCADVLTSFCAHSAGDFVQWVAGIRIVTFGAQLRKNHSAVRKQFAMLARMKKSRKPGQKPDQGGTKSPA